MVYCIEKKDNVDQRKSPFNFQSALKYIKHTHNLYYSCWFFILCVICNPAILQKCWLLQILLADNLVEIAGMTITRIWIWIGQKLILGISWDMLLNYCMCCTFLIQFMDRVIILLLYIIYVVKTLTQFCMEVYLCYYF